MWYVCGTLLHRQRLTVNRAEVDEVVRGGGLFHIHRAALQHVRPRRYAREVRRENQVVPDGLGCHDGPRLEAEVRHRRGREPDAGLVVQRRAVGHQDAHERVARYRQGPHVRRDGDRARRFILRLVRRQIDRRRRGRIRRDNPKAGTVVPAEDLPRVIKEAKAGRVEFRLDKSGNIHAPIGKVSFDQKALYENLAAFLDAVRKARPAGAKGTYIKKITLASTMGPGIHVDLSAAQGLEPIA